VLSLSLSLSLPPFFRAREAKPGAISMLVVNMLFLVAIAPDRALTARIMREDIFNRASAAAVLRSVTLTCNLQRCLACCAALGTANEGSRCRLSRRYREPPRASRDPEMTVQLFAIVSSRGCPIRRRRRRRRRRRWRQPSAAYQFRYRAATALCSIGPTEELSRALSRPGRPGRSPNHRV